MASLAPSHGPMLADLGAGDLLLAAAHDNVVRPVATTLDAVSAIHD
jgi:hypothetical protein